MPLPDGLQHAARRDLADLPPRRRAARAVGWGVHEWALRAVLEPPHARCLVVVDGVNRIVGVGIGIGYGALGVVGNMIVDATPSAPWHRCRDPGRR